MLPGQMNDEDQRKLRFLPWYYAHGALTNVFFLWTFGGTVFLLFLSQLGLPKQHIGILLSFFPFSGLVALFFAPAAARIGWKRVYIRGFAARYFVISTLLALPWVMGRWGQTAGLALVTIVMLAVALLRALGETAFYPWSQVFIPNAVRGRTNAIYTMITAVACGLALFIAGRILASGDGLGRFLWLIGIGSLIGFTGILCMLPVPAEQKHPPVGTVSHWGSMLAALRDPALLAYLAGMGLVTIGSIFLVSFLPLYIKEELGLPGDLIVTLDILVTLGGAVFSLAGGWAADRVGGQPVLLLSLAVMLLLPLAWFFLSPAVPRLILWIAALFLAYGTCTNLANLASMRLLFNRVVPAQNATSYTALYYAWMGLSGGVAPFLAGQILGGLKDLQFNIGGIHCGAYHVLFLVSFALLFAGLLAYSRTPRDGRYGTREAIGLLLRRMHRRD